MAEKLTEQEKIRRQKMEELREKGIDPFGHAYARTHRSGDIRSEYGDEMSKAAYNLSRHFRAA